MASLSLVLVRLSNPSVSSVLGGARATRYPALRFALPATINAARLLANRASLVSLLLIRAINPKLSCLVTGPLMPVTGFR